MTSFDLTFLKDKTIHRRVLHLAGSSFVGYYFIPNTLPYGIDRTWVLVIILSCVGFLEWYRWFSDRTNTINHLLRPYEQKRPASYSYFTLGSVILLAFFPQFISIPCILSTAVCDPLIGFLKHKQSKQLGFNISFFISFIFFFFVWRTSLLWIAIFASILGSIFVHLAERYSTIWLDDDFLMQILPSLLLYIIALLIKMNDSPLPEQIIYALW